FPMRVAPGRLLDPALLGLDELTLWLARRRGESAGAVAAFAGGGAIGIYYLATLPAHRGHGVARALMAAALAAHPSATVTLTATAAGEPLYRRLGFDAVGRATWWRR
ncbi:MAG: GNAT family N-acetyltransferase, partial [Actinomycetota bacterium]|nr:GNAT family N-acetyltransferase [Actinomycetota bacterium]